MSIIDSVFEILTKSEIPLTNKQLAQKLIESGMWQSNGKTPWDTVSSRLYTDIKKNGEKSRFRKVGKKALFTVAGRAPYVPPVNVAPKLRRVESESKTKTYSFCDSAELVLRKHADRKPMHASDITRIALEKGYLTTSGKTPEVTMSTSIAEEVKKVQKMRKGTPRFVLCGKGMVSLTEWQKTGVALQVKQHKDSIKAQIRKRLYAMTPEQLEHFIRRFLEALDFENTMTTQLTGDHGIDVRGTMVVADSVSFFLLERRSLRDTRKFGKIQCGYDARLLPIVWQTSHK